MLDRHRQKQNKKNKKKIIKTYRYTFAADAIHDAERRAQVRIPPLFQLVDFLAEMAICNEKNREINK
jgi:hypothetical protein